MVRENHFGRTACQKCDSVTRPRHAQRILGDRRIEALSALLGDTPRLIDEWQDIPVLWNAIRTMVDKRQKPGQFIMTGSNTVDKTEIRHSGTWRIARMRMMPMSLWETEESNGSISIRAFNNPEYDIDGKTSDLQIEDLIFTACRGGWPATVNIDNRQSKLLVARSYIDAVCNEDISRIDGKERDGL